MDRSPKARKRSLGHQDRDIAAQSLLSAAKNSGELTDSGDSDRSDHSDKENDSTLTDTMMGLKKNSRSGAKHGRQTAADIAGKAMEKATSNQASMLSVMEKRNSLFKSFVDRQAPVKEINLAPGNSEFGLCIELADMQQV